MNLDELEKLAKAATAGHWKYDENPEGLESEVWPILKEHMGHYDHYNCKFDDWRFIAAANPDTVLKLIAVVKFCKYLSTKQPDIKDQSEMIRLLAALEES